MVDTYELPPEYSSQLSIWAKKWINNALSTERYSELDIETIRDNVVGLYESAKLDVPENVVVVKSPGIGALVSGLAAGIWHLRDAKKSEEIFGRALSEEALQKAAALAISHICGSRRIEVNNKTSEKMALEATEKMTREVVGKATWEATRDANETVTSKVTCGAIMAATWEATREATWGATWEATKKATRQCPSSMTEQEILEELHKVI